MRISRPTPVASFVAGAALLAATGALAGALTVAGSAGAVGLPRPAAPAPTSAPAGAPTGAPTATPAPGETPAPADTYSPDRLTVTYGGDVDAPAGTYALRCNPAGGGGEGGLTQADVERACLRLAELGGPVGPVPAGQMCSMIYGGPQTAQVTGVWQGRKVHEEYRRTNGCEVARWGRMVPVLPAAGETQQRGDLRG